MNDLILVGRMSVSFNKYTFSSHLKSLIAGAEAVFDPISGFAFRILDGMATGVGKLMPDLRPTSVGEVVMQTKKSGSALLSTKQDEILIEITKEDGRFIFKAVSSRIKPVIFYEGNEEYAGAIWEAKVSGFLQKIVNQSFMVDYGGKRWKEGQFAELKEQFAAQGKLRQVGDKVMLKLPECKPITYSGPYAELKAEMDLKHFYQHQKTPEEELAAKPWDLLNRLLLGYLYVSGFALSPWVQNHVSLKSLDKVRAEQIAADGFLSPEELLEMARNPTLLRHVQNLAEGDVLLRNQLESVKFTENGYAQEYQAFGKSHKVNYDFSAEKETHRHTVCDMGGTCEEYMRVQSAERLVLMKKVPDGSQFHVQKATFKRAGNEWVPVNEETFTEPRILQLAGRVAETVSLPSLRSAIVTGFAAVLIARHHPKVGVFATILPLISHVAGAALSSAMQGSNPLTIVKSLSNMFVQPGDELSRSINLNTYIQSSIPGDNFDLTLTTASGGPPPNWLSLNFGPLALLKNSAGGVDKLVTLGNTAFETSGNNLRSMDISTSTPTPEGNLQLTGNPIALHIIDENTLWAPMSDGSINEVDISDPAQLSLTTIHYLNITGVTATTTSTSKEFLFLTDNKNLMAYDIKNQIQAAKIMFNLVFAINKLSYDEGYIYASSGISFNIVNVIDPYNPKNEASYNAGIRPSGAITVWKNYLYAGWALTNQINHILYGLDVWDIFNKTNPTIVKQAFLTAIPLSMAIKGSFLYLSCRDPNEMLVADNRDPLNPLIVQSLPSYGSSNMVISNNNILTGNSLTGLSIMTAPRIMSGIPMLPDRGLVLLKMVATDDYNNTVVDQFAINVGDISVPTIPNQVVYVGNGTLFTFDPFEFPNANFTYTTSPLPSFISVDPDTRKVLIAPGSGDQGVYNIGVFADNGHGGLASTSFSVTVPNRPPVLPSPLADQVAYTGKYFEYVFEPFMDGDQDILVYTAVEKGTAALPGWLSLDQASRKLYGKPYGAEVYEILITADDRHGGLKTGNLTITVPPTPPALLTGIGSQLASVGSPFRYIFPPDTFYSVDGFAFNYTAEGMPPFLTFDAETRTFEGIPTIQDAGTHSITLTATVKTKDSESCTFSLTVLNSSNNYLPPVVLRQIPDTMAYVGQQFIYTIDPKTFQDPQNGTMTYSATYEGGGTLPTYLTFNYPTFVGDFVAPQPLRLSVKATNQWGAYIVDTFAVTVVQELPPTVLNSLADSPATVGTDFSMVIPSNTFSDPNGFPVTMSVGSLPVWLEWDAAKNKLFGTPGPFDTDPFNPRILTIEVFGKNKVGSTKTSFKITVDGDSFWSTFLKVAIGITSLPAAWESRAFLWNHLCKRWYRKPTETALIGNQNYYEHIFKIERDDIKEIKVLRNGKQLNLQQPFPDGLSCKGNKLSGIPTGEDAGRYTVQAIKKGGFIVEEFELIIKKDGEDDPAPEESYWEIAKKSVTRLRIKRDPEAGTMMENLL